MAALLCRRPCRRRQLSPCLTLRERRKQLYTCFHNRSAGESRPRDFRETPSGPLFRSHQPRRGRGRWRCRRDHECDPGVPAVRPVLGGEFPVALEIEIALHVADREDEPDLRAEADDLRLEAADPIAVAAVAADLLVDVADEPATAAMSSLPWPPAGPVPPIHGATDGHSIPAESEPAKTFRPALKLA